ncbi:hypothetical protein PGT21_030910 [Puccinia graminis f. sp. tritici]|uniref:Uncharacterized protein n=1 Tax=Puccinia graminis f. sp. tritici TaxID=56615 RepID=A0A5B0QP55_PUCGR|nr:hypothetical protein PGT21_030910 [Puccinia graminis f. sp. tritici]
MSSLSYSIWYLSTAMALLSCSRRGTWFTHLRGRCSRNEGQSDKLPIFLIEVALLALPRWMMSNVMTNKFCLYRKGFGPQTSAYGSCSHIWSGLSQGCINHPSWTSLDPWCYILLRHRQ